SGVWAEVKAAGTSILATFSDDFRSAIARRSGGGQGVLVTFGEGAARWVGAGPWPSGPRGEGVSRKTLAGVVGLANKAIEKQSLLYCWFGPAVLEYVIVSGQGLDEYETYGRNCRR